MVDPNARISALRASYKAYESPHTFVHIVNSYPQLQKPITRDINQVNCGCAVPRTLKTRSAKSFSIF